MVDVIETAEITYCVPRIVAVNDTISGAMETTAAIPPIKRQSMYN